MTGLRVKHARTASKVGDLNCTDWNSDHEIADPIELSDLDNVKLLGYTLVEEKKDLSGVSSVIFDGLNGDEDIEYLLEYHITLIRSSVYTNLILRFNNDTTYTYNGVTSEQVNGTSSTINAAFIWIASTGNSLNGTIDGSCNLFVESGKVRNVLGSYVSSRGTNLSNDRFVGNWSDTISNVNSIVLLASDGGLISGTIRLWKRIPVNGGG